MNIIAFDLDDTLTESKQALTSDMAALLVRLAAKYKVAVISGASIAQFQKQFIPFLSGDLTNFILLPNNGTLRYGYSNVTDAWEVIASHDFPTELRERAKAALEQVIAGDFDIPVEHFGEYVEDRGTQITLSALGQSAPLDKKTAWDPTQAKRQKIKAFLEPLLPEVEIAIGGKTSVDILPKGSNKAAGLLLLISELGYTKEDMLFIGDAVFPGGNDYSPLEAGIKTEKVSGPADTMRLIQQFL